MTHHPIARLFPLPLPSRRRLALLLIAFAAAMAALLPGTAAAAQTARACAKAHAAHGARCTVRPARHVKPARHAKARRKPRRRMAPKHGAVSHERQHRPRTTRARTARRKPHPPAGRARRAPRHARAPQAPLAARTVGGAKPQLLASCGYTPATRRLLHSQAIYVVDERSGTVLLERHANQIKPIASVSKLMTAVVSLDRRVPLAHRLRVSVSDRDTIKFTGSRLKVGSVLSRRDMLHIALMSSENRAAAALSRDYPGGRAAFIAAMNRKARVLGMTNTHFVNATGLSPHNVSTARDLARLVSAADRYPTIRAFSTDHAQVVHPGHGQLSYVNSNALVRGGDTRIQLQKTGFINEAGHCLVIRYRIGTRPVDVVLLDAPGPHDHVADAIRIRNWLACSLH
ncbi:D-alanyl-D-alanine endopeptidase [Burkholderia plantarii]|uniref:D-alanyl-D-alanine carboxypeptidasefamilyprotein n=1 Tax=Burkholderia plantarii TaxID=41899 RepID=A0A0B6RQ01_BURPL|nr:D-alanyl-D-alanine endopeptidase [Burkholderia plantarii]AJK47387.1 D-alanyl-D-alanine carboxypeptidasefamilyprotein [Burkholderia plantarii]